MVIITFSMGVGTYSWFCLSFVGIVFFNCWYFKCKYEEECIMNLEKDLKSSAEHLSCYDFSWVFRRMGKLM